MINLSSLSSESCKEFGTFAGLQGLNFLLIVINVRASSHLQYTATALSDFVICLLTWTLLKRVSEAKGWPARLGYAVGGAAGSVLAIWLTKAWGG